MVDIYKLAKSDYLKLVPILLLAFYMAFIPKINYPYPVHIDEWHSLTYSETLIKTGDINIPDPWLGSQAPPYNKEEIGFHVFLGVFHQISGISWLFMFRYLQSFIFVLTTLSVFILARRKGFGWEAALFTTLIPTTVGILGPAFVVPVALALPFIPLSLFVAFNCRNRLSYIVLFIFLCFLLAIHAVTAIGLVIVLTPYVLLNIKGNFKHSLGMMLSLFFIFIVPFPWLFSRLLPTLREFLSVTNPSMYIDYPRIITGYGYIPILLGLLGVLILAVRGGKERYGLVFGLLALLLMLVSFFTFHHGIEILYLRSLIYVMLLIGITAGAGLMEIRSFKLPGWFTGWLRYPIVTQNVGNFMCLVLIGLVLATGIPQRQHTNYYHMIDKDDYETFVWIRDNVASSYNKAILDPWKSTAFTAITGKNVFTRIIVRPEPIDDEVYSFLSGNCSDTYFLEKNRISIVYTQGQCTNPNLVEVRKWVYLLEEAQSP